MSDIKNFTDYIDRQLAIEAIKNDSCELVYYSKEDAISCIISEPAARVRKDIRATWEFVAKTLDGAVYKCSNCNEKRRFDKYSDWYTSYHFCPIVDQQ